LLVGREADELAADVVLGHTQEPAGGPELPGIELDGPVGRSSRDPGVGWTAEEFAEHVRGESSTDSWLLDTMLDHTGFDVFERSFRRSAYGTYVQALRFLTPCAPRREVVTGCGHGKRGDNERANISEAPTSGETTIEVTSGETPSEVTTSGETPIERLEVQRTIPADAATIFRVLCDPQGHVAIDSSGMLMDATGEPVSAVGDSFVVHMDREALNDYPLGRYDVTVTITTFVPDREIAWTIRGRIRPQIGHIYGYTLAPVDGGTVVTSYYDWSAIDPTWKEAGIFPVLSEGALRATLGILDRTITRAGTGASTSA
jgi:hypothetical protein